MKIKEMVLSGRGLTGDDQLLRSMLPSKWSLCVFFLAGIVGVYSAIGQCFKGDYCLAQKTFTLNSDMLCCRI